MAQMSAEATNNVTNSVPAADSSLAANVTEAVTNSTQQVFDRFFQAASQSSSFVRCARMYSVNWCVGSWVRGTGTRVGGFGGTPTPPVVNAAGWGACTDACTDACLWHA